MNQSVAMSLSEQWKVNGYSFQEELFQPHEMTKMLRISENVWQQWLEASAENGQAGNPNAHCMRHLNHPGYFKNNDADFITLMNFIADERILQFAEEILEAPPVFRTSTFWFEPEEGIVDGNWHRDIQFQEPDEQVQKDYIAQHHKTTGIQIQIALIETEDNEYVPGSHLRWDTPEEYHIRLADEQQHNKSNDMPGALRVHQNPGDALAFDPAGLHRGRYHSNIKRRTMMLTYNTAEAYRFDYFSDQPWLFSEKHMELLPTSTQNFFKRYQDLYRNDVMKQNK